MSIDEAVKQAGGTAKALAQSAPVLLIMSGMCAGILWIAYQATSHTREQMDRVLDREATMIEAIRIADEERTQRFLERFGELEKSVLRIEHKIDTHVARFNRLYPSRPIKRDNPHP